MSISLRLIDRLERILDELAELCVKHLRKRVVQPKSSANMGLGRTITINNGLGEGQVDYAAYIAGLGEGAGHDRLNASINNDPRFRAYFDGLTRPNHHFLSHQPYPFSENHPDLASLNAKLAGVEGRG